MDKNVKNVIVSYMDRAQVGFEKYGTTTERTDVDLLGWLQHLQEELMDATIYIERLKQEVTDNGKTKCESERLREPKRFEHSPGNYAVELGQSDHEEASLRDAKHFVQRHETR